MQALHSKLFRVGEPHNLFLLDYENKNVIYIKKKTQERAVVSQTKSKIIIIIIIIMEREKKKIC
jgi:hypothetical protein